jgi:hypothetical protein
MKYGIVVHDFDGARLVDVAYTTKVAAQKQASEYEKHSEVYRVDVVDIEFFLNTLYW